MQAKEGERTSCGARASTLSLYFCVFLIVVLAHLSFSSSAAILVNHPRRARFLTMETRSSLPSTKTASFHAPLSSSLIDPKGDQVFEDEKRLIHTGPNPLHN